MRLFIKEGFVFFLLFCCSIIFVNSVANFQIRNKSYFKINSNPQYIVLGHSHPESAFNDSIIYGLKNFAKSGEAYFYTYIKLREILKQNNSIKTVFIEFSNKQITAEMDNWIWDDQHLLENYPKYSAFMNVDERFFLIKKNPRGVLKAVPLTIKSKLNIILSQEYNFIKKIGGYVYLNKNKTDKILRDLSRKKSHKKDIRKNLKNISNDNLFYLKKTIELARSHNKNVCLLRVPQHSKYQEFANEVTFKKIVKNNFGDVEFLDFSRFTVSNAEFADLGHLNYKGAKRFSTWFNQLIENGLLISNEKQVFIDKNMIGL